MNANVSVCCVSLVLLLRLVAAKPASELQALKQLLEAEEAEVGARDDANGSVFGAAEETWDPSEDHVLARLLQDLVRSTKRSWNRHKKGGLRSCFGVRLERIGSFSGLGC